jgi:excisionase family DNA binding protein
MRLGIDVKDLVTVEQAAEQLGISKQAIHQSLRDGRLEGVRLEAIFLLSKDIDPMNRPGLISKVARREIVAK